MKALLMAGKVNEAVLSPLLKQLSTHSLEQGFHYILAEKIENVTVS